MVARMNFVKHKSNAFLLPSTFNPFQTFPITQDKHKGPHLACRALDALGPPCHSVILPLALSHTGLLLSQIYPCSLPPHSLGTPCMVNSDSAMKSLVSLAQEISPWPPQPSEIPLTCSFLPLTTVVLHICVFSY